MEAWVGNKSSAKPRWDRMAASSGLLCIQGFIIFVMDGLALAQVDPVHNLGVLLESWLLLKEQAVVEAKRTFAKLRGMPDRPLPESGNLSVTHVLVISIWPLQCTLHGTTLKNIRSINWCRMWLQSNLGYPKDDTCNTFAAWAALGAGLFLVPVQGVSYYL